MVEDGGKDVDRLHLDELEELEAHMYKTLQKLRGRS